MWVVRNSGRKEKLLFYACYFQKQKSKFMELNFLIFNVVIVFGAVILKFQVKV